MSVPPVAHRTMCIDFDGTLFPWGPLISDAPPFRGAVEFVKSARDAGYKIVILTSRLSQTWWSAEVELRRGQEVEEWLEGVQAFGLTQRKYVAETLRFWDIPFDRITAEKVPAEYYIDDRAVEFHGDWSTISDRILGGSI